MQWSYPPIPPLPDADHPVHRYRATCAWSGSTASGYETYHRAHVVTTPPVAEPWTMSSDAAFGGDPRRVNPEQLLVASAASCQLLSFLAVAARARQEVIAYRDQAEAVMPEGEKPLRVTDIYLRPHITVPPPADEAKLRRLVEVAHRECFIANSINAAIHISPEFSVGHPEPT
jgi:organic hydroperoxide reductase OsmC/OhrA